MQTGIFGDIPIARISGKDTRYANRGMSLEKLINGTNDIYDAENRAVMVKQNVEIKRIYSQGRELKGAFPTGKSIVDYLGQINIGDICIPCAIEAKHSDGKAIALDRVQPHQKEFLSKWTRHKAIGIVLVWLQGAQSKNGFGRAYLIPYEYWMLADIAGMSGRPMGIEVIAGMHWTAPGKKSLTGDDMHPSWEVEIGAHGVRWLETVERIWGRA
jgi:recombination protein U